MMKTQGRDLSNRDMVIYAAIGLGVWLNGALTFRLGGAFLFERGPLVSVAVALFVAVLWAVIFVDVRPAFARLFQSRLQPHA